MTWTLVGENPECEVLAIGYQDECIVGHLSYIKGRKTWVCENDSQILTHVTAYIPVNELVQTYYNNLPI